MIDILGKIRIGEVIKYTAVLFIGIIVLFGAVSFIEVITEKPDTDERFNQGERKPAIYLYPTEVTNIEVLLSIKGELTVSEPLYDDGWNVIAYPNGTIESVEGKHDYLFYEAILDKIEIPQEGWCIGYDSLESWMTETLNKLGLNENESDEFKEYWLDVLPYKSFYEIRLLSQEFLDEYMGLEVFPSPDTIIRVNLVFKGISNYNSIINPIISKIARNGFTVVEWGGILLE